MLLHWNENAGFRQDQEADITGDGFVGLDDLNFMLTNWNQVTPPMALSSTVPEPASVTVLALLGFACAARRGCVAETLNLILCCDSGMNPLEKLVDYRLVAC